MILNRLYDQNLIQPPKWAIPNCHFLAVTGSTAYGCNNADSSDEDLVGWVIPPKEIAFPHLAGEIEGFGTLKPRFTTWQKHHIDDPESRKQYDVTLYGVAKFFHLCMANNPNMLDVLFTPRRCVKHCTQVGEILRENRKLFLSSHCYQKFRGYAYSQLHKMGIKQPKEGSKRFENVQKFGFDVKFGYHLIRLLLEAEQILTEGDLDLERNSEILKSVRRGDWTEEKILSWFDIKEKSMEELYAKSTLPRKPDEEAIRKVLMNVFEAHYGSIADAVREENVAEKTLWEIQSLLQQRGFY